MKTAYQGIGLKYSHSFGASRWSVSGLYGIVTGSVFAGESMFADVSNASKVAFVWAVHQMVRWGIKLIDCQVHTEHLERFGAREIPRDMYMRLLYLYAQEEVQIRPKFDEGFYPF